MERATLGPTLRIRPIDKKDSRSGEVDEAISWLVAYLDSEPRLVRDIRKSAEEKGISQTLLRRAARLLPILRRPRELRGPWIWKLPNNDELVPVRYDCPVARCARSFEGWMAFGATRPLFSAGILSYRTRGLVRQTRPSEDKDQLLLLVGPR